MLRFPPKKILVAVDLSRLSYAAYYQADDLAKRFGASIEVLHVQPLPAVAFGPKAEIKNITANLRKELRSRLRARMGSSTRIVIAEGDPSAVILRYARTHRPDLIAMGTHGRTGLKRLLLGSVAEEVVRRSPAPVLVVRGKPHPIRTVLAPVNFTDYSDFGFVYAAGVAAALNARLTALHVYDYPYDDLGSRSLLQEKISRLPAWVQERCKPQGQILKGSASQQIAPVAAKHDLVVLVAHRKNEIMEMVLGTTAEQVLRRSKKPVLTVPMPSKRLPPLESSWKPAQIKQ